MDKATIKRLEKKGWTVGNAYDFLGLTPEEKEKGYKKILYSILKGLDGLCFFFDDILPFYRGCPLLKILMFIQKKFNLTYLFIASHPYILQQIFHFTKPIAKLEIHNGSPLIVNEFIK